MEQKQLNLKKPLSADKRQQPSSTQPYATGPGNYNLESGRKTLYFVGTIIAIITVLSIYSLFTINKKSGVLIQSSTIDTTNAASFKKQATPSLSPTNSYNKNTK